MKYEVNLCCDCEAPGYPCLGERCPERHAIRYKCDICGEEDLIKEEIHNIDGQDYCPECYARLEEEAEREELNGDERDFLWGT